MLAGGKAVTETVQWLPAMSRDLYGLSQKVQLLHFDKLITATVPSVNFWKAEEANFHMAGIEERLPKASSHQRMVLLVQALKRNFLSRQS